jgi:membrane protease YdiL (CAAX protease family)
MDRDREATNMSSTAQLPRRTLLLELLVFLSLIVPSLLLSALVRQQEPLGFAVTAVAIITRDASLVALVIYFLWRNRESLQSIGWGRFRVKEVLIGLGLFVPTSFVIFVLDSLLRAAGLSGPQQMPTFLLAKGTPEMVLGVVLAVVVAIAEETIFRGYLFLRLASVTRSKTLAVLLTSAIFALGHGYEGEVGMVTVGVMGAIFALVYLWRKSLVAPIVMHLMQDLLAIVVLPNLHLGR